MYDYDRKDKFGNKRELHVDKALDVVDTKKYVPFNINGTVLDENLNYHILVSCKYFECFKYSINGDCNISVDNTSFVSVIVISGAGKIDVNSNIEYNKTNDVRSHNINCFGIRYHHLMVFYI